MMKNLLILPAVALAFFLAVPQSADATKVQNDYTVIQEKVVKYTEVTAATLPEAVSNSLTKDYSGYATDKVFLGDDGSYKVVSSKGDDKKALFFNEKGEFVKAEKKAEKAGTLEMKKETPKETPVPNENKETPAPVEKAL